MLSAQNITVQVVKIATGLQNHLIIDDLSADLEVEIDGSTMPNSYCITRDFIRNAFYKIGIEIEFSGKGRYEKGVIIDIDTDKLNNLSLATDIIRFGQTVVKIDGDYIQ